MSIYKYIFHDVISILRCVAKEILSKVDVIYCDELFRILNTVVFPVDCESMLTREGIGKYQYVNTRKNLSIFYTLLFKF